MNRFEQLIEYVINDEEQKARELFHDIVVEKSREIYENLMSEEAEEDLDEAADEESDDLEEGDESLMADVEMEEESDMNMEAEGDEEAMGGDSQNDFIDDVEAGDDSEFGSDEGGSDEPATKDDIMNLEDKLDELMAEFEAAMGGDDMGSDGDMMGPDEGGDAIEMDDTEEMTDDMGMMEAISLKAAPKPVTSEQGDGKAGPVAFNSGAAGMASKPVRSTGDVAQGRPAPTTKDLIGDFQNKAGASMKDQKPATKPHLAQATGVNTKSPLPGGKG